GERYGSLAEGAPANLSVIEVLERVMTMTDSFRGTRQSKQVIAAVATIQDGNYQLVADAGLPDSRGA
ncbi:MAG: hypothetical protein M3439_13030, partial [Chloroflexota bacterium]|nr:hypothetical protein [Chloroflexota bacterium]